MIRKRMSIDLIKFDMIDFIRFLGLFLNAKGEKNGQRNAGYYRKK